MGKTLLDKDRPLKDGGGKFLWANLDSPNPLVDKNGILSL